MVYVTQGLLTACEQEQDGTAVPSCSCSQCKTPDDGQRNCPKHVEFYSKNKFEKLVAAFRAESFVFQVAIQKFKYQDI